MVDQPLADWLADYRFTGSIWGYPEGEVYFPGSPLMIVEGSFAGEININSIHRGAHQNAYVGYWIDQRLAGQGYMPESVVAADEVDQVRDRSVVVKRLQPILVEAVVRGYLAGSGWKEYQENQSVCGVALPAGLKCTVVFPDGAGGS